ncbi:MAG: dihydrodipicolinate synthase family protein, partial [Planctomycetota bacterium]
VGITDTCFTESLNTANKARDTGAKAVVLAPPYYFPSGQAELLEYLEHLTPELPLPVFLYNMPSLTKAVFEPQTVKAATQISGIAGIKDSSGNMVYFHQLQSILRDHPGFALLVGREELLAESVLLDGHGGVCGGANFIPKLYVDLYNAACSRDLPTVEALHEKVMQISSAIYSVGHYESSYLKGLKCTLSCRNICSDFLAEPFHRFRQEEHDKIQRYVQELGIAPKK